MYFYSKTSSYSFCIHLWDYFGFLHLISKYIHIFGCIVIISENYSSR